MSKKNKQIIKWILFAITICFNVFILVESMLPAAYSSLQSDFIANLFGDLYVPNTTSVAIENIYFSSDEKIEITKGTTRSIDIEIYPTNAKLETISFEGEGNGTNFNLVNDGQRCYIEGYEIGNYTITAYLNARPEIYATTTFSIVERPAPIEYYVAAPKENLMVGDSMMLDITYTANGNFADELNASRYYDKNKLSFQTNNDDIVSIDNNGIIKGKKAGKCTIIIMPGNQTIDLTVQEATNPLVYPEEINLSGPNEVHIYDMDYLESGDIVANQMKVDFGEITPSNDDVFFKVEDELLARVESDGTIFGYKKTGKTKVYAYSVMNPEIYAYKEIVVEEVIPESFDIICDNSTLDTYEFALNNSKTFRGVFSPINTTNTNIVANSNNDIIGISNNGRSVIIQTLAIGNCEVTFKSAANNSLEKTIQIKVVKLPPSEDANYDDFITFVRKSIGHFSLFFIDGILAFFVVLLLLNDNKKIKSWMCALISLGMIIFVAGLSELFQFIPTDRSPSIIDVLINMAGALIGIALSIGILSIVKVVKYKKRKKNG